MNFRNKIRVKAASEIFSECPECSCAILVQFEGESFCTYCAWDSISLRAEAAENLPNFSIQEVLV